MERHSELTERICNVMIIDKQAVIRFGIKAILEQKNDEYIFRVWSAGGAQEAFEKLDRFQADVALIDDHVQDGKGKQLTESLLQVRPDLRILGMAEEHENWRVRDMISAGALGYIRKNVSPIELYNAVVRAYTGKNYFSAYIANSLLEEERITYEKQQRAPDTLSRRELEVLRLLARGQTTKEISTALRIGIRTVETHRKHLYRKAKAKNAAAMIRLAYEYGLLP